jgi:hypothetical protein
MAVNEIETRGKDGENKKFRPNALDIRREYSRQYAKNDSTKD